MPGAAEGEITQEFITTSPDAKVNVHKCTWCTAWQDAELLSFGRLYCREIDIALMRGYNPSLKITVDGTLSNDAPHCSFTYFGANLTPENREMVAQKKAAVSDRAVMPWEYHCGHLYRTVREVVSAEIGEHGNAAAQQALADFSERFGTEAAKIVDSYATVNFDLLPE